jgi:hypothetical protein
MEVSVLREQDVVESRPDSSERLPLKEGRVGEMGRIGPRVEIRPRRSSLE